MIVRTFLAFLSVTISFLYTMAEESNYQHLLGDNDSVSWQDKTEDYWKNNLSKLQYKVCRANGTEIPFTGKYNKFYEDGFYYCSNCGLKLFASKTKFNSGTGWPSFYDVANSESVKLITDKSYGMTRIEAKCSRCDAHLGHVFDDGPKPTGKRYCINSVCLVHEKDLQKQVKKPSDLEQKEPAGE